MAAQKKYPDEPRERAARMVLEIRERDGKGHGEIARGGPAAGRSPGGPAFLAAAGGNLFRYNEERLHSYCGDIPPKEFEEIYYKAAVIR